MKLLSLLPHLLIHARSKQAPVEHAVKWMLRSVSQGSGTDVDMGENGRQISELFEKQHGAGSSANDVPESRNGAGGARSWNDFEAALLHLVIRRVTCLQVREQWATDCLQMLKANCTERCRSSAMFSLVSLANAYDKNTTISGGDAEQEDETEYRKQRSDLAKAVKVKVAEELMRALRGLEGESSLLRQRAAQALARMIT